MASVYLIFDIVDAAFKALVQLAADILLKQKTEDAIKGMATVSP